MARKTKKADFKVTRPSIGGGEPHFSGAWGVFESYKICKVDDELPYIRAQGEVKKTYRPLADTPDLFLEFARLAEVTLSEETILDWVQQYGVLGLHYEDGTPPTLEFHQGTVRPPIMYDWEGGRAETIQGFMLEARQAQSVLSLYEAVYEAVLNKDDEKLLRWALQGTASQEDVERAVKNLWESQPSALVQIKNALVKLPSNPHTTLSEMLVDKALFEVWGIVQGKLSDFAYPAINHESPYTVSLPHCHTGDLFAPHRLAASWGFRNLLGAMWLQFFWLITSRAHLKRCPYCNRIISLAPPISPTTGKPRKPRDDKTYCNKQCQQNYHYHNRKKPKSKRS